MSNENETSNIDGLEIRYTEVSDAKYLKQWLLEPGVLRWFPMADEVEIDDAVNRWIGFYRYKCSLTAVLNGEPCGIATLFLQPYKKLIHQCEFGIIVGSQYRGKKVGSNLINNLIHLAKEVFHIKLLHLQVYTENPAVRLYSRFGFREFGRQTHWLLEEDEEGNPVYRGRLFMEKFLN